MVRQYLKYHSESTSVFPLTPPKMLLLWHYQVSGFAVAVYISCFAPPKNKGKGVHGVKVYCGLGFLFVWAEVGGYLKFSFVPHQCLMSTSNPIQTGGASSHLVQHKCPAFLVCLASGSPVVFGSGILPCENPLKITHVFQDRSNTVTLFFDLKRPLLKYESTQKPE